MRLAAKTSTFSSEVNGTHENAGALLRRYVGFAVCKKCKELDTKIEQYQRLCRSTIDQPTIDGYKELINDLFGKKLDLHTRPAEPNK